MAIAFDEGSSPRSRGAPEDARVHAVPAGIIPAFAGSTQAHRVVWAANGDYPRVRGEHMVTPVTVDVRSGSSPRSRGAPC